MKNDSVQRHSEQAIHLTCQSKKIDRGRLVCFRFFFCWLTRPKTGPSLSDNHWMMLKMDRMGKKKKNSFSTFFTFPENFSLPFFFFLQCQPFSEPNFSLFGLRTTQSADSIVWALPLWSSKARCPVLSLRQIVANDGRKRDLEMVIMSLLCQSWWCHLWLTSELWQAWQYLCNGFFSQTSHLILHWLHKWRG